MAIAYVEHPVTPAEKADLRKKFTKIVDIRFAPAALSNGDEKILKTKKKAKGE